MHFTYLPHTKHIKCLISDVDGVMNSGVLHFDNEGNEVYKDFHVKDGLGIKLFTGLGLDFVVITGRSSPILKKRLGSLGVKTIFENIGQKLDCLRAYLDKKAILATEIAYIGDDLNDLEILAYLYNEGGVGFCPSDAVPLIKETALYTTKLAGGQGCVREVIDYILWQNQKHV